jgi:hypothetical protein
MGEENDNGDEAAMSCPSHYSSSADQEQRCAGSEEGCISQEVRVRELEAEVNALQGLVCHLLERNERLRMRLQMLPSIVRKL